MDGRSHPGARKARSFRAYAGLLLFGFALCFSVYGIQPLLHEIAGEFGKSMSGMGVLVAVCLFSLCLSPLFAGPVIDRIGARRAIVASGAVLAAVLALLPLCGSYRFLLAIRCVQAAVMPVAMTSILASVAYVFRHMDLTRAVAAYFAGNLAGSLTSRVLGGWIAEVAGWRFAMAMAAPLFLAAAALVATNLGDPPRAGRRTRSLREHLAVLRVPRAASLLYAEACSLFAFTGVGVLIPFRIAELDASAGTGRTGTMYAGYLLGVAISLGEGRLQKLFGGPTRMLAAGAALYAAGFLPMAAPSQAALFASVCAIAAANYLVHSVAPGYLNAQAAGRCDRAAVNALFYSIYSTGGLLGSLLPVLAYERLGWTCAFGLVEAVLLSSFLVLLRLHLRQPDRMVRR